MMRQAGHLAPKEDEEQRLLLLDPKASR